MPAIQKLRDVAPYAIVLCGATYLYYVADHITYVAIPGQMGPERWPKIIVCVLAFISAMEIVRRLVIPAAAVSATRPDESEDEWLHSKQTHIGPSRT